MQITFTATVEIDPDEWATEYAIGRDEKDSAVREDIVDYYADIEARMDYLNEMKAFGPVTKVVDLRRGRIKASSGASPVAADPATEEHRCPRCRIYPVEAPRSLHRDPPTEEQR